MSHFSVNLLFVPVYHSIKGIIAIYVIYEELHAFRGYFGPSGAKKCKKKCFSPNDTDWFIRTTTKVNKSSLYLSINVAMRTENGHRNSLKTEIFVIFHQI